MAISHGTVFGRFHVWGGSFIGDLCDGLGNIPNIVGLVLLRAHRIVRTNVDKLGFQLQSGSNGPNTPEYDPKS
jgi:hypothetical protein